MVLVSVVMPSYNYARYLAESIGSILNQTFKDFELIIIDDCSTDGSKEIVAAYQKKDQRIRAFLHDRNVGIAKTLNEGIEKSKGKYVAFLDSDDVWVESKLEMQLSVLSTDESLIVWSEGEIIDGRGVSKGESFTEMHFAQCKRKSGNIFGDLLSGYGNFVFGSSVILKRAYLKDIRFCEKLKYYNDYKFFVDLARRHLFFFFPQPLAKYRVHGKNAILTDEVGWKRDYIAFGGLMLQEYGGSISNRLKASLFLQIGASYSFLGNKELTRKHYLDSVRLYPFHKNNLSLLISALANGDDYTGKFFAKFRSLLVRINLRN